MDRERAGALVDEAVWQATRTLAGEVLRDDDELRAFRSGLQDAEWNGVYRARPRSGTPGADLRDRATALFVGTPFTWHLGPGSGTEMVSTMAGLPFEEEEPGMVADLRLRHSLPAGGPGDVDLVPVATDDQLAAWVDVLTGGRGPAGLVALRRPAALGGPGPHVLAVTRGRPVGCAAVFLSGPAAVVDHVVTVSDARHRGIGTLLTRWALDTALEEGHHAAVLTASPAGRRIYERLGFRAVGVVRRYRSSAA